MLLLLLAGVGNPVTVPQVTAELLALDVDVVQLRGLDRSALAVRGVDVSAWSKKGTDG